MIYHCNHDFNSIVYIYNNIYKNIIMQYLQLINKHINIISIIQIILIESLT